MASVTTGGLVGGLVVDFWIGNDAEPTLEQVTAVFQREVTSLRVISYQDASGNVETISTTDEHPFYAAGRGWVSASDLRTTGFMPNIVRRAKASGKRGGCH